MKTLLALLIILGAGGYYLYTLRHENAKMKGQMDKMSEMLSDEDHAQLASGKGGGTTSAVHKRVVCPHCKGEGSITTRRLVNDIVTDVKTICALCMGMGKREFTLPKGAEVCPDCGGLGKRPVINVKTQKRREVDAPGGFSQQSTSCARCAGKGSIVRPGLR